MREPKISFNTGKLQLIAISLRTKKNELKNSEEYAVLKVGISDAFDGHAFSFKKPKRKEVSLVCFDEKIFRRLVEGDIFRFSGMIHLEYGSTYFRVDRVADSLGFLITSEDSIYFGNFEPYEVGEILRGEERSEECEKLSAYAEILIERNEFLERKEKIAS